MTRESSTPESGRNRRPHATALFGAIVPFAAGFVVLTGVPWAGAAWASAASASAASACAASAGIPTHPKGQGD